MSPSTTPGSLVEQVSNCRGKAESLRFVVFIHLECVHEVGIRLRVPRRPSGIGIADTNRARRWILGHIDPVSAPVQVSVFDRAGIPNTNFIGRAHRAAFISNLEQAQRCVHTSPRQGEIHIALEGVRAVSRQGSTTGA